MLSRCAVSRTAEDENDVTLVINDLLSILHVAVPIPDCNPSRTTRCADVTVA